VAIAAGAILAPPALGDASVEASCLGLISSRVSPPGSYMPAPEGRDYIAHLAKGTAETLGFHSPGGYTSYVAHFRGSEIGPECS
jgi:hypothetical protein